MGTRSSPEGDRKALWSRPQARNPCATRGYSMKGRSTQSRERVKGGTPLWGQGAAPPWVPPINTRAHYAVALNPIARRVSRGSKTLRGCRAEPCRSPEAEPLAPPLYTKNSYFPCKSTKFEPEFRLNSGGFFFECVLYYMNEGSVRCKTDRNQTPPFRNDDAGEVGIVE